MRLRDWNQSKVSYYFDFALVPVLCVLLFLLTDTSLSTLAALPAGFIVWTFLEYWIHRTVFHRLFRPQHWLHHLRPHDYVAAPAWLTSLLHVSTCALLSLLGSIGTGLFIGLEAGYFTYIATHGAIHHCNRNTMGSWLRSLDEHHALHHRGEEKNFGVFTHVWDHVFRTYLDPRLTAGWRMGWTARKGT